MIRDDLPTRDHLGTRDHMGQFRLLRLQVVNWGTFHGYKDFPIDERGVILTGPSGSGKSSLLDAHSVVLLPTFDQSFNASADLTARGAKRAARSIADYVRGAWSVNDDEHHQAQVQYLRGNSATWSAVAATYDNGAGTKATAVAIKWFPNSGTDGASLKSWYQLHAGDFDLLELQSWASAGFDTRGWRARNPHVESFDTQAAYQDALRRRVGIGSSSAALALLGKAKAMKNVGDLDAFIRTYMLDRPQTYAKAERLVENFTQLDEAYRAAARAQAQEIALRPMPEAYNNYRTAEVGTTRAADLLGSPMLSYLRGHRLRLIQEKMDAIEAARAGTDAQIARLEDRAEERKQRYNELLTQLRREQGEVGVLEAELQSRELEAQVRQRTYQRFAEHVSKLGQRPPESAEEFAALAQQVPHLSDQATSAAQQLADQVHEAYSTEADARRAVAAVDAELAVLDRRSSLLPPAMLDQRDAIATATGIAASDLPYAAELIDIRAAEHDRWAGAAERVLRPLATTLLVPAQFERVVSEFVSSQHVNGVVTYQVVTDASAVEPDARSLAAKVSVDDTTLVGRWLTGAVARAARHRCVDNAHELAQFDDAVTDSGLVKNSGGRYRKDDRRSVADRAQWVLGTNTESKRAALQHRRDELAAILASAEAKSEGLRDELARHRAVADGANAIAQYSNWSEIDHKLAQDQAAELADRISDARSGNAALGELEIAADNVYSDLAAAQTKIGALTETLNRAGGEFDGLLTEFERLSAESVPAMSNSDRELLDTALWYLLADGARQLTLDTYGEIRADLRAELERAQAAATAQRDAAETKILRCAEAFLREWPEAANELRADVESAPDFVAVHQNLIAHGLAAATEKFRRLITTDMSHSVSNLFKEVDDTHRSITRGIADVNAGLRRVEFNEGTYLQIAYATLPSPEAKEFAALVDDMVRDAPAAKRAEAGAMAAQFKRIRGLVLRLTGDSPEARKWTESVLDVRSGYSFYGKEVRVGAAPEAPPEVTYRNTATNSGGEQEKLVAFCLAAALSFALSNHNPDGPSEPTFAPLMLDEAFSKSDERFSAQSLRAFEQFGFQLVIAAPIRMVGIVEPFIGQVILVDKQTGTDGNRSDARYATFGELLGAGST